MKAKELDKVFDEGKEDILKHLDLSTAYRPNQEQKRVNVDFPIWMIDGLDKEANRLGIPRQSLIKVLIGEHLRPSESRSKKQTA
ncbi:MAG: type II toxin-antitoxin system BrnA family antitoxin [Puniceicoccales bacterium]